MGVLKDEEQGKKQNERVRAYYICVYVYVGRVGSRERFRIRGSGHTQAN
jgi:hypothetical protein